VDQFAVDVASGAEIRAAALFASTELDGKTLLGML
jgi:hypothetical protein